MHLVADKPRKLLAALAAAVATYFCIGVALVFGAVPDSILIVPVYLVAPSYLAQGVFQFGLRDFLLLQAATVVLFPLTLWAAIQVTLNATI
jgi:hypothetical protein